jgi:hypothetical protein
VLAEPLGDLIKSSIDPRINHEARINHVKVMVIALVSE